MNKELKKFIKKIYRRNNKIEQQYLIYKENEKMNFFLISENGNDRYAATSTEKIFENASRLNAASKIYIVHNHPGFSTLPNPSCLDRVNHQFVEALLNSLGHNTDDYIIYSRKGFYSFAERGELEVGLVKREKQKIVEMRNPYQAITPEILVKNKGYFLDLIGNKKEMFVTGEKIFISDAFDVKKIQEKLQNIKGKKILIVNSKEDEDKRFLFYKHLVPFDEVLFVNDGTFNGTIEFEFVQKQLEEGGLERAAL